MITNKLHAHAGSEQGHETPPTTMPTTELTDAPTLPAGEYTIALIIIKPLYIELV